MVKIKEWFDENLSKVSFFDRILWKNYLSVLGIVSSIVTLISFFLTAQNVKNTMVVICIATIFIITLVIIFMFMWWGANHKKIVKLKINNTKIRIGEGDIFELLQKDVSERHGEISIIAANNYYDTIVDNRIIAEKSLHGQYLNYLEKEGKVDLLNRTIEEDEILNKPENRKEKPERLKGRKICYAIGSVVEFESYVLTAFTKFNENNKAFLSAEDYTHFWMCFWKNIDEIYAGRTMNIPLMGAGITRFQNGKPSKQQLLEVMLWTLKISGFHNTYGDKQINFVIYKADVEEIDFYHIQHNQNFR